MRLLVDHDIEGYTILLWGSLLAEGWLELVEIDFLMLATAGLPSNSSDREIWHYVCSTLNAKRQRLIESRL